MGERGGDTNVRIKGAAARIKAMPVMRWRTAMAVNCSNKIKNRLTPYMKVNGARTTSRFSELISGDSVDNPVRPKACTTVRMTRQETRKNRNLDKVGFLNGTSNPARNSAETQLPPNLGKSFWMISRTLVASFCQ